jgi:hypothetical protein
MKVKDQAALLRATMDSKALTARCNESGLRMKRAS